MTRPIYNPRSYWDNVARQIKDRPETRVIAGDEEPYYNYKREKFLALLHSIEWRNRTVLEVGCGPGGNLKEISKHNPAELYGVDISEEMLALAREQTSGTEARVIAVDGLSLPFSASRFDITFTATVLQHITDEQQLAKLAGEISRVTRSDIYIFEGIERRRKYSVSNTGRTINDYKNLFETHGFVLQEIKFASLEFSYLACGAIRKFFNNRKRAEGEAVSTLSRKLQNMVLPVTKRLDNLIRIKRDLAMLHFKKAN